MNNTHDEPSYIEKVLKDAKRNNTKDNKSPYDVYINMYEQQLNNANSLESTLTNSKKEEIISYLDYTIEEKNLNVAFPVMNFANEIGLNIEYESSFEFSGKIKDKIITVNKNDCVTRKNFTIAHELGHYFLHIKEKATERIDYRGLQEYSPSQKKEELEADEFAGELLMPKALVIKFYTILRDKSLYTEEILYYLAHIFNVSKMAITFKCNKLKLIHSWHGITF